MEDMWTPFRELQTAVENTIARPDESSIDDFEKLLANHRQNFLTLLKNPPKNKEHRDLLEKATSSEMSIAGMGSVQLPKEIVTEAIILSDMYDLNELMALDLLGTAQTQMANYPDIPRGVVAVLLYYDGRKALVMALKALVKARKGNLWTVVTSIRISDFVTSYTDELMKDGIIIKIMDLLCVLDKSKEIDVLQKNHALGPPKYYQQVVDLFDSTKQSLAEIIFLWSGQCGLPKEPTFALLTFLRNAKPDEDANGGIDNVCLLLQLAFLYTIDISLVHKEDGGVLQRRVPLLIPGEQFFSALQEEISNKNKSWTSPGLQVITLMGWAITISTLRQAPQLIPSGVALENADLIMEDAIDGKVFNYLNTSVLLNEMLYKEVFMLKRVHNLFTDFISQMSQKVREMRLRAEETDKTIHAYIHEGLDPPANLSHNFKDMLLAIAHLYSKDPLNLQLELDYWCPPESHNLTSFSYRTQSKQMSLYNFILQTSEVLPSTLFVPYLKMLSSLASCPKGARQCFQFLKNNDNKNLTWDHFFSSFNRYYNHLRQEALPISDTVYRTGPFNKGITSHELQGLQSVLDLIKSVAENDPISADMFCQLSSWSAVNILLGLATCPIPISLKAHLFGTLSGFAASSTCAATLWHSIESAQIIATVPSTSSFQRRGIQTELEEIECRNEEYPLTRSVLRLFNALTDKMIPKLLGASQRTPGFDPYLNFILNAILLRFNGRPYKSIQEKWEVCDLALSLVCKLLLQYDPMSDEFLAKHVQAYSIGTAQVNPPPGYHIMISLCSKSELLRLILLLIDEGCRIFDEHSTFAGKKELENATFSALKMLEHGLGIQHQFLNLLNSGNSSLLLVGLNRLILGINPVTNKPDHLLNIAKYVTYENLLSRNSLSAMNILHLITLSPTPHGHLLSLFTAGGLRNGFVVALEADEEEEEIIQVKTSICNFLLQTLGQGAPNVAHYLFGFDLTKEIKKTEFQQPGVRGQSRSCLHSVISRLNSFLIHPSENAPGLVELYYKIIYALTYNTRTSEPVLRFLRSSGDFLRRHLMALPFSDEPSDVELRQMSWLLKTVAIEMKVTGSNQQLSQLASIVNVFTGDQKQSDNDTIDQTFMHTGLERVKTNEQLVLRLIKHMKFDLQSVPLPPIDYFDANLVKKLISENEVDLGRIKLIDIKAVYVALQRHANVSEDNTSNIGGNTSGSAGTTTTPAPGGQTPASGPPLRRQHVIQEIQDTITYVSNLNSAKKINQATVKYFDAWRQATEVMFAVATQDALNLEKRFNLLVDVIHELLNKAVLSSTQTDIANLVSGSVLLLCVNLRQTYVSEVGKSDETDSKLCNFMDSNQYKLNTILTNLIKWILASGVATQKLRANLYAALLNFLHINRERLAGVPRGINNGGNSARGDSYVTFLDQTTLEGPRPSFSLRMSTLDPIRSYGDRLVDILCHDSSTGHDICKMLALSCLDMVVELDCDITWTSVLSTRGYLKFIIHSLLESDKQLVTLLSNNVKSLRALYVYEGKMALLCRVASTPAGAEMLLEQNALACLSALHVYNKHPEITTNIPIPMMDMDFVPNVSTRYLQILSPALALCDAIISSMGVENQMAIVQVLKFLLCHGEMVTLVLRSGSPFHPLCYLKELAQLTGVIARATNDDMIRAVGEEGMDPGSVLESTSLFSRVQRLMLSLVSRFVISESLLRDIEKDVDPQGTNPRAKSEIVTTFLQIVSHLLLYARNIVSNGGMDRRVTNVVFQPALADSLPDRRDMLTMQEATLGVIVQQLVQAVQHHTREKGNLESAIRKLETVKNLDTKSLEQYFPQQNSNINDLDESERRRHVSKILLEQRDDKQNELEYCYFIIEHCMYIIWAHLDFYMLRGLSANTLDLAKQPKGQQTIDYDVTWNVTCDDLNHLKQGLLSTFNDTFSKTVVSIVKDMDSKDKGFLEALLRRIKKLIQFAPNY